MSIVWSCAASAFIAVTAVACFLPAIIRGRRERREAAPLPRRVPRTILPPADRNPGWPDLSQDELCQLRDLTEFRDSASAGRLLLGTRLADDLRKNLDLSDTDIARVLLLVSGFGDRCEEEQMDKAGAFAAFTDGIAVAAADLGAMELIFAPEGWPL